MNDKALCPICGAGHVTSHVDELETEYKGEKALVSSHYLLCDACGSDFAGADEMRANKRAVMAFRKQVDGLLSGAEIAALREAASPYPGESAARIVEIVAADQSELVDPSIVTEVPWERHRQFPFAALGF